MSHVVAFSVNPFLFFSIRQLDAGLEEAVSTLIWATPRLQTEVLELKVVSTIGLNKVLVLPI